MVNSQPALPSRFLAAVFLGQQASCLSAVVEAESPAVAERDLFGLPGGVLRVSGKTVFNAASDSPTSMIKRRRQSNLGTGKQ